ncbi:FAD-dependent oxidoreductase [candidate division CSSED10-310 bacterium]|uniref:FAD-dependent oxidoreductase n=1 Tax=candidate division CSSED10-310 bacterium TaxID=2855610 RepID=A0ABV6YUT2_UNCC1
MTRMRRKVIVVGGTAAGTSAAAAIARLSDDHDILLLEQGKYIAVGTCSLPEYIKGTIEDHQALIHHDGTSFQEKYGVIVRTSNQVTKITPLRRTITVHDLSQNVHYDEHYDFLILATGARPYRLNIPGCKSDNIFSLKSLESAIQLRSYIRQYEPRRALIVGAGTIGIIMAEAFQQMGMSVVLVEKTNQILNHLDLEIAERIRGYIPTQSIQIYQDSQINEYLSDASHCTGCRLEHMAEPIATDLVLETIGVEPTIDLARQAGLQVGNTGAIHVDQTMKTSQFNIYAAGDGIELTNLVTGKPGYYPRGSNANKSGRTAGENIAGRHTRFKGVLGTTLVQCFNLQIGMTGITEKEANRLDYHPLSIEITALSRVKGYPRAAPMFLKLIFSRNGRILGGQFFGTDGIKGATQTLALAIQHKASLSDLAYCDFGYHPSLSPAWDPLNIAARAGLRRLRS